MAGVVEGFRWALLGSPALPLPTLLASALIVLLALISGLSYFRCIGKSFADIV
jgi:lipopolysaccharide transport system permease protein